jgi:5-formyltetrahydrofolate cyclo-ligase
MVVMRTVEELMKQKQDIRQSARHKRQAQQHKDELSLQIGQKLLALPEYAAARTVMFYVDHASEVRTRCLFPAVWAAGKRIVVPHCVENEILLFLLEIMEELAPGTLGILEPRIELRNLPGRQVDANQLDLIVVPGLAFDARGGRLGQGKGYYDRFLARAAAGAPLVALAFECQMFPEIPMLPGDVYVDMVLTEAAVYTRA